MRQAQMSQDVTEGPGDNTCSICFLFFQFFIGLLLILLLQVAAGVLGATFRSDVCIYT